MEREVLQGVAQVVVAKREALQRGRCCREGGVAEREVLQRGTCCREGGVAERDVLQRGRCCTVLHR